MLNKYSLSLLRKIESDGDEMRSLGSLFHDKGPATAKALSVNFDRYLRAENCRHDPDRKPGSARVE